MGYAKREPSTLCCNRTITSWATSKNWMNESERMAHDALPSFGRVEFHHSLVPHTHTQVLLRPWYGAEYTMVATNKWEYRAYSLFQLPPCAMNADAVDRSLSTEGRQGRVLETRVTKKLANPLAKTAQCRKRQYVGNRTRLMVLQDSKKMHHRK